MRSLTPFLMKKRVYISQSEVSKSIVVVSIVLTSLQVDVHVGGELVESLAEAGPDTPEHEAPPTSAEDVPDAGKRGHATLIFHILHLRVDYEF